MIPYSVEGMGGSSRTWELGGVRIIVNVELWLGIQRARAWLLMINGSGGIAERLRLRMWLI